MRWFLRRLVFYAFAVWVALTLNFLLPRLMPGDPIGGVLQRLSPAQIQANPGIVQTYAVLSAESVTDAHPGQAWFQARFQGLRALLVESLKQVCGPENLRPEAEIESAAEAIVAVMDGLQIQWLLDPEAVDLAGSTAFTIEAILAAVVRPLDVPSILRQ